MAKPVVIVTGGSGGIGSSLVEGFLRKSDHIVISADIVPPKPASEPLFKQYAERCRFIKTDLGEEKDIRQLVDYVIASFGRIDCLVNNAAIAHAVMGADVIAEWRKTIAVNLTAPFILATLCAPHLAHSKGPSIINISSTRAHMSEPNTYAYSASKGGLNALTHSLAMSLSPQGIRVNTVSPGWIWFEGQPPLTEADHKFHPAGRVGVPQDVTEMVLFLADANKSGYVTGQEFIVDGGVTKKMIYP